MAFQIIFIDDLIGGQPISKTLDSYSDRQTTKILRSLKYLQEFGINRANPNLKKIKSTPLWESRILGQDNLRLICAPYHYRQILILHIFPKKTGKTPIKELNVARKRFDQALDH